MDDVAKFKRGEHRELGRLQSIGVRSASGSKTTAAKTTAANLEYKRATSSERRSDLPRSHQKRIVPRHNQADHTNGVITENY